MWLKAIRFSEDDVLVLADLHLHPSWMCWLVLHSLGDTGVYKHIGLAELVCVDFLTCDVEHVPLSALASLFPSEVDIRAAVCWL